MPRFMLVIIGLAMWLPPASVYADATASAPRQLADSDEKKADGQVVEDEWQTRIWNGKAWVAKELRLLETKKAGKVFVATHASLVNADVVFLCYAKQSMPEGKDFEIVAKVSGGGKVGLQRANGTKQGAILKEIDRTEPITIKIKRESGKITYLIANQPGNPVSGKNAGDEQGYVFVVELSRKESIRIHEFQMTVAK